MEAVYNYGQRFGKSIVTVCLMKRGKQFARGLSLCSKLEEPNPTKGVNKAKGRAKAALINKRSDLPINRDEAIRILFETESPPFRFKSEFPAKLTPFEEKLIAEAA